MMKKVIYNLITVSALLVVTGMINILSANPVWADEERRERHGYSGQERYGSHECPMHKYEREDCEGGKCEKCRHAKQKREMECSHECPVHRPYKKRGEDDGERCEKCGQRTSKRAKECIRMCLKHIHHHMGRCEKCGHESSGHDRECCACEAERQNRCAGKGKTETEEKGEMREEW
ncbi:MAG: hypothetical protein E3K32_01725 [wastewater metagenome]|nr:hypothetical protein [Candidatus Loosdrechtia aerotolerans]